LGGWVGWVGWVVGGWLGGEEAEEAEEEAEEDQAPQPRRPLPLTSLSIFFRARRCGRLSGEKARAAFSSLIGSVTRPRNY
jgi:hypothetical protein